jgi:hypothetical protein
VLSRLRVSLDNVPAMQHQYRYFPTTLADDRVVLGLGVVLPPHDALMVSSLDHAGRPLDPMHRVMNSSTRSAARLANSVG